MRCSSAHETSDLRVRTLSKEERKALEAGLRSSDAFVLRRCQILLASALGERPGRAPASDSRKSRVWLPDAAQRHPRLQPPRPGRPTSRLVASQRSPRAAFDESGAQEALREMLHQDPRKYGKESSLWTLRMAAEVSFEEGITDRELSGETIRATLERRLGVRWELSPSAGSRAPIPNTPAKRGSRPADPARREPSTALVCRFRGRDVVFSLRATFFAFVGGWPKADVRLLAKEARKDDPEPKALSCYGLYLPEMEETWLRFVDGHPVSAITTRFLGWCCYRL